MYGCPHTDSLGADIHFVISIVLVNNSMISNITTTAPVGFIVAKGPDHFAKDKVLYDLSCHWKFTSVARELCIPVT